jgi:cystathionine beta-lyase
VRLQRHQQNAHTLIEWLQKQLLVKRVLYPALDSDLGFPLWSRDFRGASGLLV